jgi:hypothetical protein
MLMANVIKDEEKLEQLHIVKLENSLASFRKFDISKM